MYVKVHEKQMQNNSTGIEKGTSGVSSVPQGFGKDEQVEQDSTPTCKALAN